MKTDRLFLSVLRGADSGSTTPFFNTSNQKLIRACLATLAEQLTAPVDPPLERTRRRPVKLVVAPAPADPSGAK
jgi:hypothetical protein